MTEKTIHFTCNDRHCKGNSLKFTLLNECPYCGSEMNPDFGNLDEQLHLAIKTLPVQIARPLAEIYISVSDFKRLHLMSDVLLGFLRLQGHVLVAYYEQEGLSEGEIDQLIETQFSKDTHGGWTALCTKILNMLVERKDERFPGALYSLFGVTVKYIQQPKIVRPTVKNEVIDWKGKKQLLEITNTPLELLINFRNRYVGHGTVYTEQDSAAVFNVFEPIMISLLQLVNACFEGVELWDKKAGSLSGYAAACDSEISVKYPSTALNIPHTEQLKVAERSKKNSGHFRCANSACGLSKKGVHLAVGGTCPECDAELELLTNELMVKDDIEIIHTYPYFLAHPYKRALEEQDPFRKLHLLKETFLNYLKYLGLVTASEYFSSDLKIGEVNRNFRNFLYRPQFGHWNAFMRNALKALEEHGHIWFVKELPKYYEEIETIPYQEKGATLIGELIEFRNHYLGHATVPSDEESIQIWEKFAPKMKELLLKLDFCKSYTIVSNDNARSWRLMGNELTPVNLSKKLKGNVAMINSKGEELNLLPFYIQPITGEFAERAKIMVYEQNTGSRIVFFSPESVHGETSGKVLEDLNLMVRNKEKLDPIKLETLDASFFRKLIKENNDELIDTLVRERKIIEGVYQERQDAEVALRSWIGARAGLFFLTAEAGSGKTNLLAEMMRQYTERGIDTIFLRGNRFNSADLQEELISRLNLEKGVEFDQLGFIEYTQENPLMILIDGANEHSASAKLFENILLFLEKHKGGHIKVVLSWRVNTKSELPVADEKYQSIVYAEKTDGITEDTLIQRSCYWLKPLNKKEVESAWEIYTGNKTGKDKIGRKPNFSYEQLTYHDRSLSDQLDNPLLMRLFLEMFHGKGLPKSRGGFISIWTLYHQKLISQ
jgi:hypothetical protein